MTEPNEEADEGAGTGHYGPGYGEAPAGPRPDAGPGSAERPKESTDVVAPAGLEPLSPQLDPNAPGTPPVPA